MLAEGLILMVAVAVAERPARKSPEELNALIRRAQAGDRGAAGQVVRAVDGLCVQLASGYARHSYGFETDDLIQEARLAVLAAVRWFKPELGYQFSTYAADCIRRRLWSHVQTRKFRPLAGYDRPEDSDHTGSVRDAADAIADPASDRPVTPDTSKEVVDDMLSRLNPVSAAIVRLKHGLAGEGPLGVKEIARRLGLTVFAVKRLYAAALQAMRGHDPTGSN